MPIDYRMLKVGAETRDGKVTVCPLCGKNGVRRDYAKGQPAAVVIHKYVWQHGFPVVQKDGSCAIIRESPHA